MKKSHRPARIAAALFDFDGTLADTERFGIELDDEAYAYYDIKPTPAEKASLAGTDGSESVPALFRAYGMEVSAEEFFAHRRPNNIIYQEFPIKHRLGLPRSFAGCTRMARVSPWSRPRSTHS